jgi:hypothetical protein
MPLSDTGGCVLQTERGLLDDNCMNRNNVGRTVFDLAPLLEMSSYDLFCLRTRASLFDTPDIKRAVLSRKSADTTHVITVVGKLVACEAVLARIGQCTFWVRECVQVLALPSVGAAPARKKETAIAYSGCICASQPCILLDVAARLRFCLTRRIESIYDTG